MVRFSLLSFFIFGHGALLEAALFKLPIALIFVFCQVENEANFGQHHIVMAELASNYAVPAGLVDDRTDVLFEGIDVDPFHWMAIWVILQGKPLASPLILHTFELIIVSLARSLPCLAVREEETETEILRIAQRA